MRERKYLLLLLLGTFFLVIFNLPESVSVALRGACREGFASYQGGIMRILSRLHRTSSTIGSASDLARERDRLAEDVAHLRSRVQMLERLDRENQQLRALLGFRQRLGLRTEVCRVIARDDGYGWWQTIRLDKGRSEGITPNRPVITPDGVVGKTIEVSSHTCDVLLISDRNFKVGVRFDQDGSFGVLHGGGVTLRGDPSLAAVCLPEPFQVDYLRKDLVVKKGETVLTSGLGGVFPPGLAVGTVVGVKPDETGLYQVATVFPVADLARLQEVLVVVEE